MPWPNTITEQFDLVNRFTTDESEYYGPYITLLTHLFPHDEHYQVAPQFKGPITPGAVDFTVIYIVMKRKVPVFFIEVKPYIHIQRNSTRELADDQMRRRFRDFSGSNLPIPRLYGISTFGTRFSIYQYTVANRVLTPSLIASDPDIVTDVAPEGRWNYDLFEAAGEAKFREIVADVRAMAAAIGN